MPNIITHNLFAETVYKRCRKKDIRELMETHMQLFTIGANGPDFLFFYHMKPWQLHQEHALNHVGSTLHASHVNDFYESALNTISKESDAFVKELELVYIMGHLCHWALDMTTHPYIFYRTGNGTGTSAIMHHRFESMLDAMMLKKLKNTDIKTYRYFESCEFDDEMLKAIARIYVPAVATLLEQRIRVYDLRQALTSWRDIQKMLYDPNGKKEKLVKRLETWTHKPGVLSGYIVPAVIDERYDVMNEQKNIWMHPCDAGQFNVASFEELFEEAVQTALDAIEKLYGCVEYDAPVSRLLELLGDRAYDTGKEGNIEMVNFDVIYDETI